MALFKKKRPWYADGLAFECAECGQCCSGPEEGYVWIGEQEIHDAAAVLGMSEQEFVQQYTRLVGRRISLTEKPVSVDCVFLEEDGEGVKHCQIYQARPVQCRTWPFWSMNLGSDNSWAQAGERCLGINRGSLHDLEHIENEKSRTG